MPLTAKLAFYFRQKSVILGRELFNSGAVRIVHGDARKLNARVLGSRWYDTELKLNDENLWTSCSCPYFDEHGPCKHLWAVLLEADRKTLLADALAVPHLTLTEENGDLDEGDPSDWDLSHVFKPLQAPPSLVSRWQDDLKFIQASVSQKRQSRARFSSEFEVIYVVDLAGSNASNAVVIEIFSRSRKKNGEWSTLKEFRVSPSEIATLPDPLDVETSRPFRQR